MTPEERIEAAAEKILRAQGTSLRNYTASTQEEILDATREEMSKSYILGSNEAEKIITTPPWLPQLLEALGWQGGTIHQVLEEVRRLRVQGQQATTCAVCGGYKHTPLRRDEMGGYVCLTCIDKRLDQFTALEAKGAQG